MKVSVSWEGGHKFALCNIRMHEIFRVLLDSSEEGFRFRRVFWPFVSARDALCWKRYHEGDRGDEKMSEGIEIP